MSKQRGEEWVLVLHTGPAVGPFRTQEEAYTWAMAHLREPATVGTTRVLFNPNNPNIPGRKAP